MFTYYLKGYGVVEFYKKINSNSSIQNLSTQLQIQTQEQYQNTID